MISFIVIGMNEARTLALTIKSINRYITHNKIDNYEIIYIDSHSTDNSIEIVKEFKDVKVFEIKGERNAAIARNIGAIEAKGKVFIFLDADMEIQKEFHQVAFTNNGKLKYPFMSGQLKNIFYNEKWQKIDENLHFPTLTKDIFTPLTGGFFIIERDLWFFIDGMRTKYRRSQDIDLSLRLAKRGTLLLRKKELFVVHHTISYLDRRRVWKMLFDGSLLFQTSVMIRDHLFNPYIYKRFFRTNYTLIVLFISIILGLFLSPYFLLIHPIVIGAKILILKKPIELFIYYYLRDIFSFLGLFFFFPREKKLIYELVK